MCHQNNMSSRFSPTSEDADQPIPLYNLIEFTNTCKGLIILFIITQFWIGPLLKDGNQKCIDHTEK